MKFNIDELTLGELKDIHIELSGIFGEVTKEAVQVTGGINKETNKPLIGEYCIIRCRDAGVHAGYVEDWYDRTVILKESRRLWYWKCKTGHSLNGLAESGLHSDSKIPAVVSQIVLTDACEIIPTSNQFKEDCKNAPVHNS
jgi:hypothetical protein